MIEYDARHFVHFSVSGLYYYPTRGIWHDGMNKRVLCVCLYEFLGEYVLGRLSVFIFL